MDFKIGQVKHYFGKIGVAIIKLDADLAIGEKIKFKKRESELFVQNVDSLQIGHEKVNSASSGAVVAVRTDKPVKEETEVFKIQI